MSLIYGTRSYRISHHGCYGGMLQSFTLPGTREKILQYSYILTCRSSSSGGSILALLFLWENTLDIFLYKICNFDYLNDNLIYLSMATLWLSLNLESPFLLHTPRRWNDFNFTIDLGDDILFRYVYIYFYYSNWFFYESSNLIRRIKTVVNRFLEIN